MTMPPWMKTQPSTMREGVDVGLTKVMVPPGWMVTPPSTVAGDSGDTVMDPPEAIEMEVLRYHTPDGRQMKLGPGEGAAHAEFCTALVSVAHITSREVPL